LFHANHETYGIETREETNKTKRMLRVAEMKTLRTIMGKTMIDRIRNTDIREQYGVQDIVRWGRQRKRYWYTHVRRMEEGRPCKEEEEEEDNKQPV